MNYFKNLLVNSIPLGLFLYGVLQLGPYTAVALNISLFIYITIIILSLLLPFMPPALLFANRMPLKSMSNTVKMTAKAFSTHYQMFTVIIDIVATAVLAYFGYNVLAIFYVLHIFGYLIMFHHVKLYVLDVFTPEMFTNVSVNLKEAIKRGDTEFSFFELMGSKHPE